MKLTFWRTWSVITTALVVTLFMLANAPRAQADDVPPYGGCAEAMDYSNTEGADWCRDHGYVVTRHIVVSPNKYVLAWDMPACAGENSRKGPCRWNFGGNTGNGEGRKYWVNRNGVRHYVKGVA